MFGCHYYFDHLCFPHFSLASGRHHRQRHLRRGGGLREEGWDRGRLFGGMDSGQPQPPMPTEYEADIAEIQAWLGHAKIITTKIYDRRENRPEDSPKFKVKY